MPKRVGDSTRPLRVPLHPRDVNYMKPERFKDYLTLAETAREVNRDPSWLRKLESDGRIPKAHRVKFGKIMIRLWSPNQIEEIKMVVNNMKRGRPSGG